MELIRRLPQLRVPEELFRLTESPDRRVRAFVIRSLWQTYRERGVTEEWKPPVAKVPALGAKGIKEVEKRNAERGDGVPERPVTWPAQKPSLAAFLRRVLFEIPPGPPEKSTASEDDDAAQNSQKGMKVKPIAARRAKHDAVETMRDMACRDREFAAGILPLLREFLLSRGVSERAACLVAVTRIETLHPELKPGHDA